jgi:hypothetical protein
VNVEGVEGVGVIAGDGEWVDWKPALPVLFSGAPKTKPGFFVNRELCIGEG